MLSSQLGRVEVCPQEDIYVSKLSIIDAPVRGRGGAPPFEGETIPLFDDRINSELK